MTITTAISPERQKAMDYLTVRADGMPAEQVLARFRAAVAEFDAAVAAFDEDEDLVGIREADAGLLESAITLDPYAARAVHHHLAHTLVAQERRKRGKPEQPVFEPPLQLAELARRNNDPLR